MISTEGLDTMVSANSNTAEIEATEFSGHKLTPLTQQNHSAPRGTPCIDRANYKLTVDGQVNHPLSLSYADLLAYPQIPQLIELDCVEGWKYWAKWTGPYLSDILDDAKVKSDAKVVVFHTADSPEGFSTLDLNYIYVNKIIIALKNNDVTLPAAKGFPFQVIAKDNSKWAKWVTRIELSPDSSFRGYSQINVYKSVFCNCSAAPWWWPFPWWPR